MIGLLAAFPVSAAGQEKQTKFVLLLFDEDRGLPGLSVLERTLRSTLSAGLEGNVEGLGLVSMGERVEAFGGTFKVQASPHSGTRVEVKLPVAEGTSPAPA